MNKYKRKISNKLFPVKPPLYIHKLAKKFVWNVKNDDAIYLTFDDGPTENITSEILQILKQKDVKATFFCIGRNVERYPDIYKKIIDCGHKTGNHTYSHLNGWKTKFDEYIHDVELASDFIKSNLFRPPYGRIKPKQFNFASKKFKIIMWDVLSGDYNKNISPETCLNNVINNVKPGSIIVFHDSIKAYKNMIYTLPKVIDILKNKNYKFAVLS